MKRISHEDYSIGDRIIGFSAAAVIYIVVALIYNGTKTNNNAPVDTDKNGSNDHNIEAESGDYKNPVEEQLYKINYINEDTIDYSNYRDVEYEPFMHNLYIKAEERINFDQLLSVDAPDGYQVDYCLPIEDSKGQIGGITYGYINLKFTNTVKVVVREYYDNSTGEYVNANFGTPVEKEKQKRIDN